MKKILFLLVVPITLLVTPMVLKAQDAPPTLPATQIISPQWYIKDSSGYKYLYMFKGLAQGWTKFNNSTNILPLNNTFTGNTNTFKNIIANNLSVTPQQYGAVGDGVSDDTTPILACLAANPCVRFYAKYKITGTLHIKSGQRIYSDNCTITYATTSGIAILADSATNWQIDGKLTIRGSGKANNTAVGIKSNYSDHFLISGVTCSNISGWGFLFTGNYKLPRGNAGMVSDCYADSCATGLDVHYHSEFLSFVNFNSTANIQGVTILAGNTSMTGGNVVDNDYGIYLGDALSTNNAHGILNGINVNHNTNNNLDCENVQYGETISNCHFYGTSTNNIIINNSYGVSFTGGIIDGLISNTDSNTPKGFHYFSGVQIEPSIAVSGYTAGLFFQRCFTINGGMWSGNTIDYVKLNTPTVQGGYSAISGSASAGHAAMATWSQNSSYARFGHESFDVLIHPGFLQDNQGSVYLDGKIVYMGDTVLVNNATNNHRDVFQISGTLGVTDGTTGNQVGTIAGNNVRYQTALVSGTNIKTINSASLLGSGNVLLQTPLVAGTDYLTPATAASTYLPLSGGALTGAINGTTSSFTNGTSWGTAGNKYMTTVSGTQKFAYTSSSVNGLYSGGGSGLIVYNQADTKELLHVDDAGTSIKLPQYTSNGIMSVSGGTGTLGVVNVVPIANGGTGTSTPGIVAGTNITVSGSWPNQTVNSSGGVPTGVSGQIFGFYDGGASIAIGRLSVQNASGIFTPATGGTITLINNNWNIVAPTGPLVALTITLPSSPSDGDRVAIKFTQAITTVTYTGGTVVDGLTSPAASNLSQLVYKSSTSSWY